MKYEYVQSDLSRSLLGGLFAGIIAAFSNLIFVFIYRAITKFYNFNVIDATVISFGSILLCIACGIVFYWLAHNMKSGITLYRILVLIVTIVIIYFGIALRRSVEADIPAEFRVLVIGTQTIIGGLAMFLIPYLFRHDKLIS
ncbi:hypothetical protein [Deminuibacter soli]|uniref:Uncharacterized protein n=1 Tax=Deminuibacter soli TaxID=2291815 RepID=A0A3E1NHW9_9BACT|nr:hypothetical protein [Deminuibacter soli]RFM27464.1 hypothetical protein DXN05_15730 [Deminuibacter soli]